MVEKCGVFGCSSNSNNGKNKQFYTVPSGYRIRQKWIDALKLNAEPSLRFKVCGLHFTPNDFKLDNTLKATAVPSLYLPNTNLNSQAGVFKIKLPMSFYDYQKQFALKFNLQQLPQYQNDSSQCNGKRKSSDSPFENNFVKRMSLPFADPIPNTINHQPVGMPVPSNLSNTSPLPTNATHNSNIDGGIIPIIDLDDYPDYDEQMGIAAPTLLEISKFEDIDSIHQTRNTIETNTKSTQTHCTEQGVFSRYLTYSREEIEYFTGLKPNRFELIINLIRRENIKLTHNDVGLHDQLLLTLFRYRHNCDFQLMQYMFKVKLEYFLTIFKECSNALYTALSKINFVSTSKRNKGNTIIVDSTNFLVERTENVNHMKLLMCSDDQQPKFKLLIACDENALIVFVSDTYGSAMPNRELFVKSEFTKRILKGEEIIPCKDFNADDILTSNGIIIRSKPYIKQNNDKIEEIKGLNTIKELINNIKENKILSDPIPVVFWPFANKIIKNCFYLNNLRNKALNTIVMLK